MRRLKQGEPQTPGLLPCSGHSITPQSARTELSAGLQILLREAGCESERAPEMQQSGYRLTGQHNRVWGFSGLLVICSLIVWRVTVNLLSLNPNPRLPVSPAK